MSEHLRSSGYPDGIDIQRQIDAALVPLEARLKQLEEQQARAETPTMPPQPTGWSENRHAYYTVEEFRLYINALRAYCEHLEQELEKKADTQSAERDQVSRIAAYLDAIRDETIRRLEAELAGYKKLSEPARPEPYGDHP